MAAGYQRDGSEGQSKEIDTALERLVQEGARRMLALEEVEAFLGRRR